MSVLSYFDAATGSMIASVVVGGFAAVVLFARRFWFRFTAIFSESRREQLEAIKREVAEPAAEDDETDAEDQAETLTFDG